MKKINSFALLLCALLVSSGLKAEKDWRFWFSVESGAEVKATVYSDFSFDVQMPLPKETAAVDPSTATITAEMRNVPSLGVTNLRHHASTISTELESTQILLNAWLNNAFEFQGATLNGKFETLDKIKPFTYTIAGINADGKIIATTNEAETRIVWENLTGVTTSTLQTPDDSYLRITTGSYLLYGDQQLMFTSDVELFKATWEMQGMLDRLKNGTIMNTFPLTGAETYKAILHVEAGSILAIGGSVATLDEACTIMFDCSNAYKGTDKSGKLTAIDPHATGQSTSNILKEAVKLVNEIVGDVDQAETVDVTVSIGITLGEEAIVMKKDVTKTSDNESIFNQLTADNDGVQSMTRAETNIVNATSGFGVDTTKCIVVVLTDITMAEVGQVYIENLKSTTYEVTPKYRDASGNLQTIPNNEIKQPITFRLPVIAEYADMMVNVYHKANVDAAEDFVGQFAVQELNGSYYVELSASEFSLYSIKDADAQYNRTTTVGMIGTICLPYDIDVAGGKATGAEFYELDYRNNTVVSQVTEVEGTEVTTTLVGGKAYLFVATGTNVHCEWTPGDTYHNAATGESMIGNLASAPIYPAELASATVAPYVVSNTGVIRPCGAGAYVPMNRAYINMKDVPTSKTNSPARRIRLGANGANIVTDIENVNANVNANRKMMVDGQFVIIRDSKMFNAIGQEL